MIAAKEATRIARLEANDIAQSGDSLFALWCNASIGEPVLVHDLQRRPLYWLVPVQLGDRVGGFVRVLSSGRVSATGALYADPTCLGTLPPTVTGIEKHEAARRAADRVRTDRGETAREPLFVSDGAPGREAWLVEVVEQDMPRRWIFVTPRFVYERPAGEVRDPARE